MDFSVSNLNRFIEQLICNDKLDLNLINEIKCWFKTLFQATKVPILQRADDVPSSEKDFVEFAGKTPDNLSLTLRLLQAMIEVATKSHSVPSDAFDIGSVPQDIIVLAAQHCNPNTDWGSKEAADIATQLQTLLIVPDDQNSTGIEKLANRLPPFDELLLIRVEGKTSYRFGFVLKLILQYLSNNFTKKLWKNDPGTKELYIWLIYALSPELLSEHLGYLLPGSLLLLDDWEPRHKLAALKALQHILDNVAGSELRCHGRAEVICAAARHHLYCRDPVILDAAYPTTIRAAAVLQADPSTAQHLQVSVSEEVLSLLLREMCHEQRLDLRRVFAAHLPAAVTAAGLLAGRWATELLEVFTNYLTTFEDERAQDRINVLKGVQSYLRLCWPQAGRDTPALLKALLHLLYGLHLYSITEQARESVLLECRLMVSLLQCARPGPGDDLFAGLRAVQLPTPVRQTLDIVFEGVPAYAAS